MLYEKRSMTDGIGAKFGQILSKLPITPNQWTMLSIIVACFGFYLAASGRYLLATATFIAAALLDMIDGAVARASGKSTLLGAYLDTFTDKFVEFIIILSIASLSIPDLIFPIKFWILLQLFSSVMVTYTKSAAKEKDFVKSEVRGGLMERPERMIALIAIIASAAYSLTLTSYLVAIVAVLTLMTVFQRFVRVLKQANL